MYFLEREWERLKLLFFGTFNIMITHIFRENFIEISQVVRRYEDMKIIFININYFHQFLGFLGISLLQTHRWHQHITDDVGFVLLSHTLNRLFNKIYSQKAPTLSGLKNFVFTMLFNSQFIKQSIANLQRQHPNQLGYYLYWTLFVIYIFIITVKFFLFQ